MSADDRYEQQNDAATGDAPAGDAMDNDYTSRTGQKQAPVPVQSDNDAVEDPIDANTADSDKQLGAFPRDLNCSSTNWLQRKTKLPPSTSQTSSTSVLAAPPNRVGLTKIQVMKRVSRRMMGRAESLSEWVS